MAKPTMEELRDAILKSPPVRWDAICSEADTETLSEVSHYLDDLLQNYARRAAYVEARATGADHSDAVKTSNKVIARVRKALGFSYPNNDLSF